MGRASDRRVAPVGRRRTGRAPELDADKSRGVACAFLCVDVAHDILGACTRRVCFLVLVMAH
jgi:hypothetical protein